MKANFKVRFVFIGLFLAGVVRVGAEPVEPLGYLRFVNGIAAGSGMVSVRVDGKDLYPNGYRFGAVTGGIGLAPASHQVEVRRDGVKSGRAEVTVKKGHAATVIAFAEELATEEGKPVQFRAQLMTVTPRVVKEGKVATFVSVSRAPLLRVDVRQPDGKWRAVELPRLATAEIPISLDRGYVALKSAGKALEAIPVADSGNYVVVLFDDAQGVLHAVNFRDSGEIAGD
ncbi:MAG: hypothetical protein V4640_03030 [Verrucomicrobiota bacterium]